MVLSVSIILFFVSLYSIVILLLSRGLKQLGRDPGPDHGSHIPVPVTVVIPFRDELERLPDLLGDLMHQSYPVDYMEIIFINDHSVDGSAEVIEGLIGSNKQFSCLDLPDDKCGKKEAIAYAVSHASGDWIIQTDADCRIGPHFIASHMSFKQEQHADLVAGLVTTRKGMGGFLEAFERLDLLSLVGTGAGSFYYNRPVMCSGANLAYSRELYKETRQFDPSGQVASGDDMFLMIGARKLGKKLSYNLNREVVAETVPVRNTGEMITQRIRWGSKTAYYKTSDIQFLALLVVITNLLIFFIPLYLVLASSLWLFFLSAFIAKTLADFALLYRITGLTGQRKSLWTFGPVSVLYYFFQVVILVGSLFVRIQWKGRNK